MLDGVYEPKQLNHVITAALSAHELIATPGVGKRIVIDRVIFSGIAGCNATTLTLLSGSTIIHGPHYFSGAAATSAFNWDSQAGFDLMCNENEALNLTTTNTTANATIDIQYHIRG